MEESAAPPLYFFLLGDTGTGDQNQLDVAAAMERRCQEIPNLNGMFLLGDLFYMAGVQGTEDEQWQEKIVTPYSSPCLAKANMYPIFGNHDYKGDKEAFLQYAEVNPRWKMPNRFYSVNFTIPIVPIATAEGSGEVSGRAPRDPRHFIKFIAIDSNFTDFCFSPKDCVVDFLVRELDDPSVWKIVLAHYPLASASKKGYRYNGETVFGKLYRWLACDKATAWVSGHSHHLEHRKMDSCASNLFISGGGGADLDSIDTRSPDMKYGSSEFGFLELEVTQQSIKTRFFSKDSKNLYEKEIPKK